MTMTLVVILISALTAAVAIALAMLYRIVRGYNKHRMISSRYLPDNSVADSIGISVLYRDVHTKSQIEKLLSVEYLRYEVVAVFDADRFPSEFGELVRLYRMFRVDYYPLGDFDARGVRGVWRSRTRSLHRLVFVDRSYDTAAGDFNAAADVAAYDYVLPLWGGCVPLPDMISRLVAEVNSSPEGSIDMVRSCLGEPVSLYRRAALADSGGFGRAFHNHRIARSRQRILWEPLLLSTGPLYRMPTFARVAITALLAATLAVTLSAGLLAASAVIITLLLLWHVLIGVDLLHDAVLRRERT